MRYFGILLLLLSNSSLFSQNVVSSNQRKQVAIQAFEKDDFSTSLALINSWLLDYPNDSEGYLYRARIWNQLQDHSKADIDYTAYLQFIPDQAEVYLERGRVRFKNGLFELAKEDFEAFLKLPKGETSQVIYRKSPSGNGISQIFTAQTPNPSQAYYHLALCSIELKEFGPALIYLDSAISNQPNEPDFYSEKGKTLALLGKKAEAELNYKKALEINPDHHLSRQRMVFLSQTVDESSLEELTQMIINSPENPDVFKQRGYFRLSHKDPSGAKEDFLKAISLDPEDAQLWYYLASSLVALKNFKDAENTCSKALNLDPKNVDYLLLRGQCRYRMNQFEPALADFTLVTIYEPDYASGFYHKGITLRQISKNKSGCEELKKAMNLGMQEARAAWEKVCVEN